MPPTKPTLMISPCGTSLLTNLADSHERSLLWEYANASEKEIPSGDLQKLRAIVEQARGTLKEATFEEVCQHSAELHTISRYYEMGQSVNERDIHILLASDTWLGKQTARLVQDWLSQHVQDVRVEERADLTTNNLMQFHSAMSDLVKYFEEQIPSYRKSGYHIVFNLTGGFKGVQGFLQTLAMFYADEAIYIFKPSNELLRLPSLPIKMDTEQEVRKNLTTFRKLSRNIPVKAAEVDPLSDMFYLEMDGEYTLSPWGELMWGEAKEKIYSEKVWPSPEQLIVFSKHFKKSLEELDHVRNKIVNERVDDLMLLINTEKNLSRLNFKKYSPNTPDLGSTHQFNVKRDSDDSRVYCRFEGNTIILDQLGDHL